MSKKIKLNLNDLKVQSFVTSIDNEENIKGGTYHTFCGTCGYPKDACKSVVNLPATGCPHHTCTGCPGGGGDNPFFGQ